VGLVDLVIKSAILVTADGLLRAGVAVHDGVIVAVGADNCLPTADNTIDARGRLLMPGLIDTHVHFRDPGHTDWESFERLSLLHLSEPTSPSSLSFAVFCL
jgi:dihydroorotase